MAKFKYFLCRFAKFNLRIIALVKRFKSGYSFGLYRSTLHCSNLILNIASLLKNSDGGLCS